MSFKGPNHPLGTVACSPLNIQVLQSIANFIVK